VNKVTVLEWKDVIIDHSQFPRRHGRLERASHEGHGENPVCGDRVHLQLLIDDSGLITDAGFEATGCAMSVASASLLSDNLLNRSIAQAEELFQAVHALLTGNPDAPATGLGELEALSLVKQYPSRVKCATLCWHVMRGALSGRQEMATTE
jgi:nitrogen fixation NifU-like protein